MIPKKGDLFYYLGHKSDICIVHQVYKYNEEYLFETLTNNPRKKYYHPLSDWKKPVHKLIKNNKLTRLFYL